MSGEIGFMEEKGLFFFLEWEDRNGPLNTDRLRL